MSTITWLAVGATTAGLVSPLVYMRLKRSRERHGDEAERQDHQYAAVAIHRAEDCCDAVDQYIGKRYLETDAPELPVEGCDKKHCQCRYQYFQDRRADEDRRYELGALFGMNPPDDEHRNRKDRRKSKVEVEARPRSYFNEY